MPTAKRHTIVAICNPTWEWWTPTFYVDCPFDPDDAFRDCKMIDEDTGKPSSECGLEHWLSEGGMESIAVEGETSWFPIHGYVRWEPDHPVLVLP